MSVNAVNEIQKNYGSYKSTYVNKAKAADSTEMIKKESVVDDYKRKHPENAAHVEKQVQAGKKIRAKNGAEHISREEMTMEEYQNYFYALLDTIPYDSTRIHDESYISISEKGWEQMKEDPDYEAWILGYFVEDRAVRNPFFGWGGSDGSIIFEHFGASIEEHHGEGFSKSSVKGNKHKEEEESWWLKRHKRMKELLKEQQFADLEKAKAEKEANLREYRSRQLKSQQNLHNFLTDRPESHPLHTEDDRQAAVASYENTAGLFHNIFMGGKPGKGF